MFFFGFRNLVVKVVVIKRLKFWSWTVIINAKVKIPKKDKSLVCKLTNYGINLLSKVVLNKYWFEKLI